MFCDYNILLSIAVKTEYEIPGSASCMWLFII